MNKIGIVPIMCGLFGGGIVVCLLIMGRPEAPAPQEKVTDKSRVESGAGTPADRDLEEENQVLHDRIGELEREIEALKSRPAAPKETAKESEPEKPETDLHTRFFRLSEKGVMAYGGKAFQELLKALKASPEEARELLVERLRNAQTAQERFFAAALLEGLHDPEAIADLAWSVEKDTDDLVRRMASHALAMIGTDGAHDPLYTAMNEDKDWGVRVNSAYGLAKLGDDAGLAMLKESYLSEETPAEYRLSILGGLADVADPTTSPIFRGILSESKDIGYLLISIGAVEKMKDKGALPELQAILNADLPGIIKEKAQEAIFNIQQ